MSAVAELAVIYDSGQTRPIAPYLQSIQALESMTSRANTPKAITSDLIKGIGRLGPAQISNLLPIRSPELTPGVVSVGAASQKALSRLALGNARPFFLVGSDALSQRWLGSRKTELLRLGAVGMLIQAETEADVRRIAELGQGLSITPGSATDIAKVLGLVHYPVLISSRGLEQ
jgi:integrating conjugative element protein (TIGR03765 family)